MAWQNLPEYVQTLEATTVNQAYENSVVLKDAIVEAGITVDSLTPISVSYETPIAQIVNVLNNMEDNLTKLDDAVPSAFYVEPWVTSTSFTRDDYKRWILILNDIYDIIINGKGNWGYLQLSDGYPTIGGKRILIRGANNG